MTAIACSLIAIDCGCAQASALEDKQERTYDFDQMNTDFEHAAVGLRRPVGLFATGASRAMSAHFAEWAEVRVQRGLARTYERLVNYMHTSSEMPGLLASVYVSVLDRAWQELREPVSEYMSEEFGKAIGARSYADADADAAADAAAHEAASRRWCFERFRAHWLRTFYPHDLSTWRMIKNPWWWLQAVLSIFPYYGVGPIYWVATFALIERTDEYQLCMYICSFKSLMAFTTGLAGILYGALRAAFAMDALLSCVQAEHVWRLAAAEALSLERLQLEEIRSLGHPLLNSTAAAAAAAAVPMTVASSSSGFVLASSVEGCSLPLGWPGGWWSFPWELGCFAVQGLTVWIAFALLPYSNDDAVALRRSLDRKGMLGGGAPCKRQPGQRTYSMASSVPSTSAASRRKQSGASPPRHKWRAVFDDDSDEDAPEGAVGTGLTSLALAVGKEVGDTADAAATSTAPAPATATVTVATITASTAATAATATALPPAVVPQRAPCGGCLPRGDRKRGGLLRRWFGYELATATFVNGLVLMEAIHLTRRVGVANGNWLLIGAWGDTEILQMRNFLYWSRMLYALLSLPCRLKRGSRTQGRVSPLVCLTLARC